GGGPGGARGVLRAKLGSAALRHRVVRGGVEAARRHVGLEVRAVLAQARARDASRAKPVVGEPEPLRERGEVHVLAPRRRREPLAAHPAAVAAARRGGGEEGEGGAGGRPGGLRAGRRGTRSATRPGWAT